MVNPPRRSFLSLTEGARENVKRVLDAAGTTTDNAVKRTVGLIDGAEVAGMNAAYRRFWSPAPPARTPFVVTARVVHGATLEIECNTAMPAT